MDKKGLTKLIGYILILVGYILTIFMENKLGEYLIIISVGIFIYYVVNAINYSQNKVKYMFRLWFTALIVQVLFTLGTNTYQLNGVFSIFIVAVLISYIEKGEWLWVHTFVTLAILIPNEYCLLSIGVAIVYYFYNKKNWKWSLKELYMIINIIIIIILVNPLYFTIACISLIATDRLSRFNTFKLSKKCCYGFLIICYTIICLIRFYLLIR